MKPKVLFIVESDPRNSGRPAEAIRVAAGVGTWKKAEIHLHLRGAAILGLGEWVDDLVDEDNFTRYLPIVGESGEPVTVETGSPFVADLGTSAIPHTPITADQLAALAAQSSSVLRF
ncbi:MAG: hypothetical protein EXS36_08025 [Pedosphaera sp.]|nr:hypothetical protein [Pedosphaera sp.]